ncbi:flagellin N-terminal-like domain-containing protein [Halomicrobium zhouii]|uniref:Flagellin N-terminal-like domain-containing protein n=1 Tax=Halomicrobium zhouii TaxID=767519 RepID=A0A1I6LHL4_9EURY|nr:type IV pilin N-terminal domain-containing protein [Halomicrobium zhouii]SFS02985.1 flagellin N-terminal-like domain-containing protein [Halomicrobium zhouii]
MNIKSLLSDDDAVSPVIGVILMVAITVILAAVIATFVLGLGDQVSNTAPQASFSFDYDGSDLTITHNGGDSINAEELFVRGTNDDGSWSDGATDTVSGSTTYSDGDKISAGDSVTVSVDDGDTVRVVYQSSEGGTSATLGTWEGPSA